MKIIIVDDESSALHIFLDEIVDQQDVDYKFFKDDPEAIYDYVKSKKVDAAFLDMRMPNIDGLDLAQELINLYDRIKIVFITGLNVSERDLPENIREHTLGFIYKPYDKGELINYLEIISEVTPCLNVTMFGPFDCNLNGRQLDFSSGKSKELFALLLVYHGRTLTMTDAISHIWSDHDIEKAKILYRDAVWRLRKTLQKVNFNCVVFTRGELNIKRENILCDYWEYLEGKSECDCNNFLTNYDWGEEYLTPPPDSNQH